MNPFLKLFANQTLAQVLCLFCMNPCESFYQASIVKETGKILIQVQRSLKTLEESGLIMSKRSGRMVYYKANTSHPAFEELKKVFLKTIGIGDLLRDGFQTHQKQIPLAWIFGSVARGEEQIDSDIDIMLISELGLESLSKIIGPLSRSIKRELNIIFFSPAEFRKKIKSNDYLITEVIKTPKIWLIGNDHELERFLERTKYKTTTC